MRISLVAAIVALGTASVAQAQYGYYPGGGMGYGNFATSGAQARGEGISAVLRGQGQKDLDESQAAINLAEAKKKEIQDRYTKADTYFGMRRLNEAFEDQEYARKHHATQADLVRYAKLAEPPRASSNEVNPVTGKIDWPEVLLVDNYTPYRTQIDSLYEQRVHSSGGIGSLNYGKVEQAVRGMTDELKRHIREMETADYLYARDFLNGLAFEARFPTK